ncbi:MAG: hypothetical protein KGL39_10415 [Patescibacteria group bacterium]|nr:hypothetical protein [Patescibacteria group bacterium]
MTTRIKSKVAARVISDKDVTDMFSDVLGTKSSAIHVTYPKYNSVMAHTDRFIKLLETLHDSPVLAPFAAEKDRLGGYLASLFRMFTATFTAPDFTPYYGGADGLNDEQRRLHAAMFDEPRYDAVPAGVREEFDKAFEAMKASDLVKSIVVTCSNLSKYRATITNPDDAKLDAFMRKPPMQFAPIHDLEALNLKQVYISDAVKDKKYIIVFVRKLYEISHAVYEAVNSPDVDVQDFVNLVMASIDDVRKVIPRCDDAFNKIRESVDLLQGNFGSYYKDYVASSNPTIIMENFVLDVSKSTNATPKLTQQFRKIIAHYKNVAKNQALNPKLQSVFKHVDSSFDYVDKGGDEGDEGEDDAKTPSDDTKTPSDESKTPATESKTPAVETKTAPVGIAKMTAQEARKKRKNQKKNQKNRLKKRTAAPSRPPSPGAEKSLADELDDADPAPGAESEAELASAEFDSLADLIDQLAPSD